MIKYKTSKKINKEIKRAIKNINFRKNSNVFQKKPEIFYCFDDITFIKDNKTTNNSIDEDKEKFILYYHYNKSKDFKKSYYFIILLYKAKK